MFREERSYFAPEVDAHYWGVELRSPNLRIARMVMKNVTSDYGLLERATPFSGNSTRSCLTLVIEGEGRFDELGRRAFTKAGDLLVSDQRARGTEAYTGTSSEILVLEWDPRVFGAPVRGRFRQVRLGLRERGVLRSLARRLSGPSPAPFAVALLDRLRAYGLPFVSVAEGDLADRTSEADRRLSAEVARQLSQLTSHPSIDDLTDALGWTTRHVNRRFAALARAHGMPFHHWRALLHHTRLLTASRLMSAPGATTELVARLTGFRSPTALCHAFAKASWPSPGTLARLAKRDVLDAWGAFAAPSASSAFEERAAMHVG